MVLLETKKLTKHFGGLVALSDVDMEIREGEIVGIIGPNGAGKTTFFNVLTGYYRPASGKVIFKGRDISGLRPDRIAKMGLVRTFQASTLFREATVMENMLVAHYLRANAGFWSTLFNTRSYRTQEKTAEQRSLEMLRDTALLPFKDELTKNLPHGHQRILGVAVALAAEPVLLLLDEPVTGLSPAEIDAFMSFIKELRERGITIAIVEHNVSLLVGVSDRMIVLNFGNKIAEGPPAGILANKDVIEAYLGSEEEY